MYNIIIKAVVLSVVLISTVFYVDVLFNGYDQAMDNIHILPKEY